MKVARWTLVIPHHSLRETEAAHNRRLMSHEVVRSGSRFGCSGVLFHEICEAVGCERRQVRGLFASARGAARSYAIRA